MWQKGDKIGGRLHAISSTIIPVLTGYSIESSYTLKCTKTEVCSGTEGTRYLRLVMADNAIFAVQKCIKTILMMYCYRMPDSVRNLTAETSGGQQRQPNSYIHQQYFS